MKKKNKILYGNPRQFKWKYMNKKKMKIISIPVTCNKPGPETTKQTPGLPVK